MGDIRGLLLAPATLVLQVAHPTVGLAVQQHSDFVAHPWRRLLRTMRSSIRFTYGTAEVAEAEATRLRRVHEGIRGVDADGVPYSALDPEASAWVHLTLGRFGVEIQRVFGTPMSPAELDTFFSEWRHVGRLLGVRDDLLPADWGAFTDYFDQAVEHTLQDNPAVRDVLHSIACPIPPSRMVPTAVWRPVAHRTGALTTLFTIGTLPAPLRRRLDVAWTPDDERRLQRRAATVGRAVSALPAPLRYYPQIAPHAAASWWHAQR
ncbi:MAG: oxygenase MpaB family protein [Acidimicrobiales bacterium]